MKNVIVVNSTPRAGGNSEILAYRFADGAKAAGHRVRVVDVRALTLKFCVGCLYCQTHAPVYYYAVSGQLKTFLDRLNPLFPRKNAFREVYLLATAAENEASAMDGSVSDIQGWIDCFDGVTLKGVLRGIGVTDKGEIENTDFPRQAYEMGQNL